MGREQVDYFNAYAKRHVRELIESRRLTWKQLARELERQLGIKYTEGALASRFSRGAFSHSFALQVLCALGQHSCPVPRSPLTHKEAKAVAKKTARKVK